MPPPPPPPPDYSSGSTYVRWGQSTCPSSSATLVYAGVAAGAPDARGGAANFLCLPQGATYEEGMYASTSSEEGQLNALEYETGTFGIVSMRVLHAQSVPCALCKRRDQNAKTLLYPGGTTCPSGFAIDYRGYIMATPGHRGEHVCVDEAAEGIGSTVSEGGVRLKPVEYATGTPVLPPEYIPNAEATCVVCGSISSGSVYTRWGRTACPASATKVYDGVVAGPSYTSSAGGANQLCMTKTPEYLTYDLTNNGGVDVRLRGKPVN